MPTKKNFKVLRSAMRISFLALFISTILACRPRPVKEPNSPPSGPKCDNPWSPSLALGPNLNGPDVSASSLKIENPKLNTQNYGSTYKGVTLQFDSDALGDIVLWRVCEDANRKNCFPENSFPWEASALDFINLPPIDKLAGKKVIVELRSCVSKLRSLDAKQKGAKLAGTVDQYKDYYCALKAVSPPPFLMPNNTAGSPQAVAIKKKISEKLIASYRYRTQEYAKVADEIQKTAEKVMARTGDSALKLTSSRTPLSSAQLTAIENFAALRDTDRAKKIAYMNVGAEEQRKLVEQTDIVEKAAKSQPSGFGLASNSNECQGTDSGSDTYGSDTYGSDTYGSDTSGASGGSSDGSGSGGNGSTGPTDGSGSNTSTNDGSGGIPQTDTPGDTTAGETPPIDGTGNSGGDGTDAAEDIDIEFKPEDEQATPSKSSGNVTGAFLAYSVGVAGIGYTAYNAGFMGKRAVDMTKEGAEWAKSLKGKSEYWSAKTAAHNELNKLYSLPGGTSPTSSINEYNKHVDNMVDKDPRLKGASNDIIEQRKAALKLPNEDSFTKRISGGATDLDTKGWRTDITDFDTKIRKSLDFGKIKGKRGSFKGLAVGLAVTVATFFIGGALSLTANTNETALENANKEMLVHGKRMMFIQDELKKLDKEILDLVIEGNELNYAN